MTSEPTDAMIEAAAEAAWASILGPRSNVPWDRQPRGMQARYRIAARTALNAALAVAPPPLDREAVESAISAYGIANYDHAVLTHAAISDPRRLRYAQRAGENAQLTYDALLALIFPDGETQ